MNEINNNYLRLNKKIKIKLMNLFLILLNYFSFIYSISIEYKNLFNWIINSNGFISNKISIKENNKNNRFLFANKKILKYEEIIKINNINIISILNSKIKQKCLKYLLNNSNFDFDCILLFFSLDKKNKNSFFNSYYNFFPVLNYEKIPLFYSKQQINKINYLNELIEFINITNININKTYYKNFFNKNISYEEFKLNYYLIISRNFVLKNNILSNINCLVPFLDLINHQNNFNSFYNFDYNSNTFILYAIRDIQINEEITISYGKLNNIELFNYYGFTLKNNQFKFNLILKIKEIKIVLDGYVFDEEILLAIDKIKNKYKINDKNALNLIKNELYNNRQILFENMYKNDDVNIINIIKDKIDIIDEYLKIINKIKV